MVNKTDTNNINPKDTISVACSGSVLSCFYHSYEYVSGKDIYCLIPNVNLSLNQKLYYCMIITANKYRYNFGRQANRTLKDILIPPLNEIPEYVDKVKLPYLECNKAIDRTQLELQTQNWRYFKISDLFNIKKGSEEIDAANSIPLATIPLISATINNNGIVTKLDKAKKVFRNCLTITSSAVPGTAFYQSGEFAATISINVCIPKFNMNKYTAIFLVTIINLEKFKFNYARKYSKQRMMNTTIKLPATKEGVIDYAFMEQYVKHLNYSGNL